MGVIQGLCIFTSIVSFKISQTLLLAYYSPTRLVSCSLFFTNEAYFLFVSLTSIQIPPSPPCSILFRLGQRCYHHWSRKSDRSLLLLIFFKYIYIYIYLLILYLKYSTPYHYFVVDILTTISLTNVTNSSI